MTVSTLCGLYGLSKFVFVSLIWICSTIVAQPFCTSWRTECSL